MGNMVYAKSIWANDRLRIDEALGFRKSDNNNKKHKNNKSKNNVRSAIVDPLPGPKCYVTGSTHPLLSL